MCYKDFFLGDLAKEMSHYCLCLPWLAGCQGNDQGSEINITTKVGSESGVMNCHCPAPFTYLVWQKGYFHPFPLTVGIQKPSHFFL